MIDEKNLIVEEVIEMIDSSFNEFLLNEEKQVEEFETSVKGKVRVIKEIYDDRFNILYIKHLNTKGLKQNDYSVAGYYDKKDVQRDFVNIKDYNVDIYTSYVGYCYDDIMHKYNGEPYIDYLNNPHEFIKMCTDKVIEINKEEIAYELVVYNFKKEYLNKILKNTNQEFRDIYTSKKILNAIEKEKFNPQKVRITINYNNKDFTFPFNYKRLVSDIRSGEIESYDYYKDYNVVSEFLKENKNSLENRYMESFELSHVKSISYGRKELYHNDNISKTKVKTKEKER